MILNGSTLNSAPINGEIQTTLAEACDLVRSRIEPELNVAIQKPVRLTSIDKTSLDEARTWRRQYHALALSEREPGWDWKDEFYGRGRRSSHVDLAVWSDNALCGMMIGQVSDGRINATIHFLESDPSNNPLKGKVAGIATLFIETLAALLGCQYAVINNPVPDLVDFYKQFGYTTETKKLKTVRSLSKKIPMVPADNG